MVERYTEAIHQSIKKVLEYHEERSAGAVGLNTYLIRAMIDEIERLQMIIDDYRQDTATVLDEKCASDERHCGCVPTLREEIKRLQKIEKEKT